MTTRSRSLVFSGFLLFVPALALAGANAGGTLILHANPTLVYTNDTSSYCGQSALDSCAAAVTSVAWDPGHTIVFHAIAAFPPGSQPRMKGVSFGINYDPAKFHLQAQGTCADFEVPDTGWPAPGIGTGQSWNDAQTSQLREVYWFAGYAYSEANPDSTSFSLIPRAADGGIFVDDAAPRMADSIAAYGSLGLGRRPSIPCPGIGGDLDWWLGNEWLLEDTEQDAYDGQMLLTPIRWKTPAANPVVYLGFVDPDANISRTQVAAIIDQSALEWTSHFSWSGVQMVTILSEDPQTQYVWDPDGFNTVNWAERDWGTGGDASIYVWPDPACRQIRVLDVDIRFWDPDFLTYFCWVDCSLPHGICPPYGDPWNNDIRSRAQHEWGHAWGIDRYEPPDYDASIMSEAWERPPQCIQRDLREADIEFADSEYMGLLYDRNEPSNDCPAGAVNFGQLGWGDAVDNGWADKLPGFLDVDNFVFTVGNAVPGTILQFHVNHGGDAEIYYWMDIYCDNWFRGSFCSAHAGDDVHVELPTETGLWEVAVRSHDGDPAPSPYRLGVAYPRPVSDVGNTVVDRSRHPALHVNPVTRVAYGDACGAPGALRLFDAAGKLVWSHSVSQGEFWIQPIDAQLASGVYFVRLEVENQSTVQRLVVVK